MGANTKGGCTAAPCSKMRKPHSPVKSSTVSPGPRRRSQRAAASWQYAAGNAEGGSRHGSAGSAAARPKSRTHTPHVKRAGNFQRTAMRTAWSLNLAAAMATSKPITGAISTQYSGGAGGFA